MYKVGLYPERRESIEGLSLEDKGKILENIFYYSTKGEIPHNSYIGVIFNFMKNRIDADRGEYEKRCEKNKEIALEREKHKRSRKSTNVHERSPDSTTSTNSNSNSNSNVSKDTIPPNPQGEDVSKKQELIEFAEKRSNVSLGGLSPLPKVEKINDKLYDAWIKKRKSYTPDEIKKGSNNYVMHIVEGKKKNPENTYFDHRFTLLEFLKQGNGLDKFINLSPNK